MSVRFMFRYGAESTQSRVHAAILELPDQDLLHWKKASSSPALQYDQGNILEKISQIHRLMLQVRKYDDLGPILHLVCLRQSKVRRAKRRQIQNCALVAAEDGIPIQNLATVRHRYERIWGQAQRHPVVLHRQKLFYLIKGQNLQSDNQSQFLDRPLTRKTLISTALHCTRNHHLLKNLKNAKRLWTKKWIAQISSH